MMCVLCVVSGIGIASLNRDDKIRFWIVCNKCKSKMVFRGGGVRVKDSASF